MREVKRNAEVGEKIKVIVDVDTGWVKTTYPLNSVHTVRKKISNDTTVTPHDFSKGLVACEGNGYLIDSSSYVVLEGKV
jgi:hypothetical protein